LYSFMKNVSHTAIQISATLVVLGIVYSSHAQTSSLQKVNTDSESKSPETISVLPLEDLRVFTRAFELIRTSYIDDIDDRTLLEYAIKGMLDELDPHSSYLNKNSYDDLKKLTSGEFGGLGVEIGTQNGFLKIISPIDDTPAQKAGIKAGDLVVKIDGSPIKNNNIGEAIEKMRGDVGTKITLTISREGVKNPFDVDIVRDIIKVRSVRSDIIDQHFGYFRISQFQVNTGKDLKKEINKIREINPNLHGVILDLRNNPGGVLMASIEVADVFINKDLIVYTEGRIKEANSQFFATSGEQFSGIPIVVLINGGSASASEIVAGALQDHKRAIILGEQSFGKGSVQKSIEITPERAIKITTSRYFTPLGRSIQAEGIQPDIIVEPAQIIPLEVQKRITEADLSGHLTNNKTSGNDSSLQTIIDNNASLQRDNQLYEAVNILRGLHLYSRSHKAQASADAVPAN